MSRRYKIRTGMHILEPGDVIMNDRNKNAWGTYALWILFSEAVGGLSGWLTREGSRIYSETAKKPPLSPPDIVFPVVWGLLFALMGAGMAMVRLEPEAPERSRATAAFLAQLTFNFLWSIIFFNLRSYGFALVWLTALWLFILWMIFCFRSVRRTAAWLQIPYIVWTSFAAYLNLGVWLLNG